MFNLKLLIMRKPLHSLSIILIALFIGWGQISFGTENGPTKVQKEPAADLFISEYLEGSSNNKALEIYNPTDQTIDLSGYVIKQANNGNGWGNTSAGADTRYVLPLSGTLAPGAVLVLANAQSNQAILDVADLTFAYVSTVNGADGNNVLAFNGDDAIGLFKADVLIDVIGDPNNDPGTNWPVAGTGATSEYTLVRKSTIQSGTDDWAASAGTNADNSQWIVYPQDTFDHLGLHGEQPDEVAPVPTFFPAAAATGVPVDVRPTITFDEEIYTTAGVLVDDTNVESLIAFTSAAKADVPFSATIADKVITIVPDADLAYGVEYMITMQPVQDAAENLMDAAASFSFVTIQEEVSADLFISEYLEGSSNNKALEIYNPTDQTIDLSGYVIKQANNGNGWGNTSAGADTRYVLPLSGTLAPGAVLVLANAQSNQAILDVADLTFAYVSTVNGADGNNVLAFNGDDAIGLFKADVLIDVIGDPNNDPGTNWPVAGTGATSEYTLVRKSNIQSGTDDWAASAGTNADNSQWFVYPQDTFEQLGLHGEQPDEAAPVPTFFPAAAATGVPVDEQPTITFDEVIYTSAGVLVDDTNVESLISFTSAAKADVPFSATIADKVISIVPDADLAYGVEYTITMQPVQDEAENLMDAAASSSFTTVVENAQAIELTGDYSVTYYAGEDVTVTWISANIENVKVEAWVPSIGDWQVMVASEPAANGTVTFTIPTTALFGTAYKIRVSDATDGEPSAESAAIKVRAVAADLLTVRSFTKNDEFRFSGEALVTATDSYNNRKFMQDANAGIMIFDKDGVITSSYTIGDKMTGLVGKLDVYNSLLQIVPLGDPGNPVSSGNAVEPTVLSITAITSDDQAKLIKLENVTFETPGTFENGKNYTITDGSNTFVIRTDFYNVDYIGTAMPTEEFNITGVILQYNTTLQIVARNAEDFEDVGSSATLNPWGTSIAAFPNPFTHTLYIDNAENATRVVVINLIGQQVMSVNLNGDSRVPIATENLAKGIYLISIENNKGERTVRKMIKR